jgi:hypothetical protein
MATCEMEMMVALEPAHVSYEQVCDMATNGLVGVCRAIIAPDVAEKLLANNNARNRGVRKGHVKFLVEQIKSDKFVFNGESIVFGDDGNINNGQHRLIACVQSKAAFEVLLVFGIPVERFSTYDQVSRRSSGDVLASIDEPNAIRLASALKHIDNYFGGGLGKSWTSANLSARGDNSYVLELKAKYPRVAKCVTRCGHFPRYTTATLAAALYWLFSQVDEEATEYFFQVVEDSPNTSEISDEILVAAAVQLRKWLTSNALGKRKHSPYTVANVWIKAWNAYRTGKVPKIYIHHDSEGQILIEDRLSRQQGK